MPALARPADEGQKALRLSAADFEPTAENDFLERALGWARRAAVRLERAGLDLDVVATQTQEARGGVRTVALRRGSHGAMLLLELSRRHVEVALELSHEATVDLESFRAHLASASGAERIFGALSLLPEQFTVGLIGTPSDGPPPSVATIDAEDVQNLLSRVVDERRPLRIGWHLDRDVALAHTQLLDEQLADALAALATPYALIARPRFATQRGRPAYAARLFRTSTRLPVRGAKARTVATGSEVRVLTGPFEGRVGIVKEIDKRGNARVLLGLLATRLGLGELALVRERPAPPSKRGGGGGGGGSKKRPALGSSHRRR